MSLNTTKKVLDIKRLTSPENRNVNLMSGNRDIDALERIKDEIDRISALIKPSKKSHMRQRLLQDALVNALHVDSYSEAEKTLITLRRKRVSASIERVLDRAAISKVKAAKSRLVGTTKVAKSKASMEVAKAVADAREAMKRARARKDDARQKIIIGGTIISAILDSAPGSLTLLDGLKVRLGEAGWKSVEPIFTPADDEKFLAEFVQEREPDIDALAAGGEVGRAELARLFHDAGARVERALDLAQTWNGTDQRQQRAADARRKITVGGAVIASIREGDSIAPALLQVLDSRIGSTRDRVAVRAILPIGEFRPKGRP